MSRAQQPPGGGSTVNPFQWDSGNSRAEPVRTSVRTTQGMDTSTVFFGGGEPAGEDQRQRKSQSDSKNRELSGSGIFSSEPIATSSNAFANNNDQNSGNFITSRPSVRLHKPAGGESQISFQDDSPTQEVKKVSQMKKYELQGSLVKGESDSVRKSSEAKVKEISGTASIFEPPPKSMPPTMPHGVQSQITFGPDDHGAPPRKVSERLIQEFSVSGKYDDDKAAAVSDQKIRDLQGCGIFLRSQEPVAPPPTGSRRPPGGKSSISLT